MKKLTKLAVAFFLLSTLLIATPALAKDPVNLKINGNSVSSQGIYQESGVSYFPVNDYINFAGADLIWDSDNTFRISENGTILTLTVGQKNALRNNEPITLAAAPIKEGDVVFIPLRAVSEAFGFEVAWDAARNTVSLIRNETKDSMTADDLMVKSTKALVDKNTYSLSGKMDMDMQLSTNGQSQPIPKISLNVNGQASTKPMGVYFQMEMNLPIPEAANAGSQVMEIYITQDKTYLKIPGSEQWMEQDLPNNEMLIKQMQIQSDPIQAVAQMKEMGMLLSLGNDISLDGQEYYTVNTSLDPQKFMEQYKKMFSGYLMAGTDPNAQKTMEKVMEKMIFDFYYKLYINKATFISDRFDVSGQMSLTLDSSEMGLPEDSGEKQEIQMIVKYNAKFLISDPGKPFKAPDVSKAIPMPTIPAQS